MKTHPTMTLKPIQQITDVNLTLWSLGTHYKVHCCEDLNHWPSTAMKGGIFPNVRATLRNTETGFITSVFLYVAKMGHVPSNQVIDAGYVTHTAIEERLLRFDCDHHDIMDVHLSTVSLPDHNGEVSGYVTITKGLYYWAEQAIGEELTIESIIGNYFEGQEWNDKIVSNYLEDHKKQLLLRGPASNN